MDKNLHTLFLAAINTSREAGAATSHYIYSDADDSTLWSVMADKQRAADDAVLAAFRALHGSQLI